MRTPRLRLSPRQRSVGLALLLLVLVAATAAVVLGPAGRSAPEQVANDGSRIGAAASARRACTLLELLLQQAAANVAGEQAVTTARQAREEADRAARADPKWVQLSSAAQAIEESLARDDAALAATGVRVGRAACARLPTPSPGG